MGSGKQHERRSRRANATQDHFEDSSTMEFDHADQKDDDLRRNTSSEDEGDEDDDSNHRQLATKDPNVANLVNHASQVMGISNADGTAMALAATNATTPAEAFNLLAASSAVANMTVQRASSNAAHAVVASDLATEGLRNADSAYEKRFKVYDEELQRLKDTDIELQQLQTRITLLEGLLGRVLSMMQNGNIDAAEVAQMLRNLGI